MVIGRDSFYSSIVITENADTISRKHCGIKYNAETREYTVTDYSSNGTYTNTGERLQRNVPRNFPAGTIICLGDKTNRFRLM
jgi:pSer/pThr/pTyr-binding forkhead associated (FHA) protein